MNKLIGKICNNIVKKYQRDKNVLGIMLFGSAIRGKFDQYSDIDFFVLLNKKGKCSRFNFIQNGFRVDIILNTKKEAESYLSGDKYSLKRITSHMLAYGKIIYQKGNYLSKLQKIAKKNLKLKTKTSKEDILMHKYSIDDFWGEAQRDIKNKDYLAFGLDSHLLLSNIIELFLRLHGKFLKQPNEMNKVLSEIDKQFSNQIQKFYKVNNIQNKKTILFNLVKYIYKKSGGELPMGWKIK